MDNEDRFRPSPPDGRPLPTGIEVAVAVLLAVPVIALLLVPTYAKEKPYLLGFPFFYWCQLIWMFLEAVDGLHRLPVAGQRARGEATASERGSCSAGRASTAVELGVVVVFFVLVTVGGFLRRALATARVACTAWTSGVWAVAASAPG